MRCLSQANQKIAQPSSAKALLCESDYMDRVCNKLYPERTSALQKRINTRSYLTSHRVTDLSNYQDSISRQINNIPLQRHSTKIKHYPKESRELLVSAASNIRQNLEVEARKLIVDLHIQANG